MTHMMFATMGGFVVQYHPGRHGDHSAARCDPNETDNVEERGSSALCRILRTASYSNDTNKSLIRTEKVFGETSNAKVNAEPNGKGIDASKSEKALDDSLPPKVWHLDCYTLRVAITRGLLSTTTASAEEISDKSKSDLFTKVLTIVQICYFCLGVIVRAGRNLSVSQLELGVSGYVACSIITYCLTFSKPKAVTTSIVLDACIADALPEKLRVIQQRQRSVYGPASYFGDARPGDAKANDCTDPSEGDSTFLWAIAITSTLFGAVHLVGWDFSAPTLVDAWLWRASAIVSTAITLILVAMSLLLYRSTGNWDIYSGLGLYALARLILIVEMFRNLLYLPSDAFIATWTANIPHIG